VARSLRRATDAITAGGESIEPSLLRRLTGLQIELDAFAQLELAALPTGRAEAGAAATPSMLKLIGSELHQRVCELAMEAAGPQAGASLAAIGINGEDLDLGARAMARHLCLRAASIYSGTSETQRNLIARQLIG
jgi:acyl-CoA dehydrogenase